QYQLTYFFFQAEDGIRDFHVTGVQTCALPICSFTSCASFSICRLVRSGVRLLGLAVLAPTLSSDTPISATTTPTSSAAQAGSIKIGRASCRERRAVDATVR